MTVSQPRLKGGEPGLLPWLGLSLCHLQMSQLSVGGIRRETARSVRPPAKTEKASKDTIQEWPSQRMSRGGGVGVGWGVRQLLKPHPHSVQAPP